ncbi:glycoside hydrolase family 3 protein [Amycolatopsis benzoatilytica]|uniref:glycoside hydrolase family 3 protein n=1 Tax=Amycolatopsis benzoatilytica TaxID=346045 RepID=UPI00037824FB|nr:glycoside hydrolase family 3 N-terminal domain-containing protein [Amycolatopsis benzoatilytica]
MSELDQIVNACLLPGYEGSAPPAWVREGLADGIAGVALFPANLEGGRQSLVRHARAVRAIAPDALIAVDEEGGDVTRLDYETGSASPGNLALGEIDDPALTGRVAAEIAADLKACGVNFNLAPSIDVNSSPDNPIIGVRSFGADPERVGVHGASFIRAMQDEGVAAVAKHFPGHGDTVTDSHRSLPVVDCSEETFRQRELPPFVAAIRAKVRAMMTAHVLYPALDPDNPATLSRRLLHDLVRKELGYEGVLLSSAIAIEAGQGNPDIGAVAVRALRAGSDLLLLGPGDGEKLCAAIRSAVTEAVRSGELTAAVLETAAARVRALRESSAPQRSGLEAARRAIRLEGDVALLAPAVVVELRAAGNAAVGEAQWSLADRLAALDAAESTVRVHADEPTPDQVLPASGPVVLVARDAYRTPWQRDWLRKALALRPDAVLVAVGMPDDVTPEVSASIRTFGAAAVNIEAAAEALTSRLAATRSR